MGYTQQTLKEVGYNGKLNHCTCSTYRLDNLTVLCAFLWRAFGNQRQARKGTTKTGATAKRTRPRSNTQGKKDAKGN